MNEIHYPARITKEDDHYLVQFIDLDEAHTYGVTKEEALYNAAEVLSLTLQGRLEDEIDIPAPSVSKGKQIHNVAPAVDVQAALLISGTMKEEGKSISDLARSLNTSWASAQRLTKPGTNITLARLQQAAGSLGKRLVLKFENDDRSHV